MAAPIPRYLVSFHPKDFAHFFTDVLIVGGGLAGLRAGIEIDPSLSVLVVTKDAWRESSSNYAQGGIAGVMDPDDTFEQHVEDTLEAGGELCDPQVVEMVVRAAPRRIGELIQWGTQFDKTEGELSLGREGGHRHNRILHALGDATGREIMRAMIEVARTRSNLRLWKNTFTLDLMVVDGVCRGALIWTGYREKAFVWSKQTILCTGGAGHVFRESTNPSVATGDGHALAYRAGAELRDLEFMQFHPTVLYIAGSSRSLITEAVRGEGAHLIDCEGTRFMPLYDERAELAPRDVVSQSIVRQMEQTRHPNVYLDMSHLDPVFVRKRFPGIAAICAEFDLDISSDRIPVRPGAHYLIGGLTVDQHGATTLPRLWAAGEVTSSGLHGANRLASNSLLEGLVYGAAVGAGASQAALQGLGQQEYCAPSLMHPARPQPTEPLDVDDIRNSLKSLMGRAAGVRRNGQQLAEAARTVEMWCKYVLNREFHEPAGWELQNMLVVARLMIDGAQRRTESRGVHFRDDFPEIDNQNWRRHITQCRGRPAD
jgi:L-aspartate oxidase